MAILELKEMRTNFTIMERQVANYILSHLDEMNNISVHSLAKAVGVSAPTVLRLCSKLGFKGFSAFKVELMAEMLGERSEHLDTEIKLGDNTAEICDKVLQIAKGGLDDTFQLLDPDKIERASELINKSQRIVIIGIGSSALIAKEMEYQLLQIKKNVFCNLDYHIQYSTLNTFTENDLLITFSHSGETRESINALLLAKQRGVTSIGITRSGTSKVAELSSLVLNICSSEEVLHLIPIRFRIAQFIIIDILMANLFIKNYHEHNETFVSNHKYFKKIL